MNFVQPIRDPEQNTAVKKSILRKRAYVITCSSLWVLIQD